VARICNGRSRVPILGIQEHIPFLTACSSRGILESEDPVWSGSSLGSTRPIVGSSRYNVSAASTTPSRCAWTKNSLRRAVRGLLPNEVLSRAKTPFEGDQVALQVRSTSGVLCRFWSPRERSKQFVAWEKLGALMGTESIGFPWTQFAPNLISLLASSY